MIHFILSALLLFLTGSIHKAYSQYQKEIIVSESDFKTIGKTPAILKEASGLYIDETRGLWSHNDDRFPILYRFDTLGKVINTIHLNHSNIGWEAITADTNGNVYIGGFGNNKNDRKDLAILKIKPLNTITERVTQGELIRFSYSDQTSFPPSANKKNYDSDALIFFQDALYIFSKNRTNPYTGYTRIYRLPQEPGTHVAELVDSIYTGKGNMMENWVTDAAVNPDKNMLALLGHDKIWLITNFEDATFSKGKITLINLPHFTHKAGLAFMDNTTLYVVDEKEFDILGGNIYKINLGLLPGFK